MRSACAAVAEQARHVHIDGKRLEAYAAELSTDALRTHPSAVEIPEGLEPDERAAFVLVLDAVNFGSGYFPMLSKRAGMSGYRTIESALGDRWNREGPLTIEALAECDPRLCAEIFGQSLSIPEIAELMGLFARAWRDLAELVERRHHGEFTALVRGARGSGAELVRELCRMPFYQDIAGYEGRIVPFLKRAQITVHDLALGVPPPLGEFGDLDELTIFADNLVPHVLRLDGVLVFTSELEARIDRGELLVSGSRQEVEIRACAVHAVERLIGRCRATGKEITARELDAWLWSRGQSAHYKKRPRHRARTVFY